MKINIWSIFLFIMLIPSLLPSYLWRFSVVSFICKIIRYTTILVIISMYIYTKQKPSKVLVLLCLYIIGLGISTQLSPTGNMSLYYSASLSIISTILLGEWAMKKKPVQFINSILFMLECWIFINLITIIIFPNGLYQSGVYSTNYLLGYDNTHIRVQILALNISYIETFIRKKKLSLRMIILYITILISNLLVFSATAIVATLIWAVGILCITLNDRKIFIKLFRLFSTKTSFIIGVLGSLIVVGMSAQTKFSYIVENIFKKDMTLSGRTYIWTNAISAIENRFLWGYGYEMNDTISKRLVGQTGFGTSPHNFYLEILYQGGIVLFLIVLAIYLYMNKEVMKYKNLLLSYVIGFWMMIIAIMGLVEPQLNINLIITWIIVSNIETIIRVREKMSSDREKEVLYEKQYIS